jgi:hypothetical protein
MVNTIVGSIPATSIVLYVFDSILKFLKIYILSGQRQLQDKKSKNYFKVDLKLIASDNVSIKNKKKSNYIIGFDPGFTKYVIKQSIKFKNK